MVDDERVDEWARGAIDTRGTRSQRLLLPGVSPKVAANNNLGKLQTPPLTPPLEGRGMPIAAVHSSEELIVAVRQAAYNSPLQGEKNAYSRCPFLRRNDCRRETSGIQFPPSRGEECL